MSPSEVGERAEAAVLAALVAAGKEVLTPFGAHRGYDLAYAENGRLVKVQCKAGRHRRGAVAFRTYYEGRGPARDYRGEIDVFGVYCHSRGEVYLVPVEDVPLRGATLRLEPTLNGQRAGVRWASDYLLARHVHVSGCSGLSASPPVPAQPQIPQID